MPKLKWTNKDFNVFQINGLEQRMDALNSNVRPKFNKLGEDFSAFFSSQLGEEFFSHVAKHARRTVNPPKDSWVAFAPYKRGYKALPHFQIGLWSSHLFIVLAIIYEAPQKKRDGGTTTCKKNHCYNSFQMISLFLVIICRHWLFRCKKLKKRS